VARKTNVKPVLGPHPSSGLGSLTQATDSNTRTGVPHRAIEEDIAQRVELIACLQEMLVRHHASREALERHKQLHKAIKRLGFGAQQHKIKLFPTNSTTQKGNLAEIVLAEYVVSASGMKLPVYRLRYNPNVEQSMKGDDVLAFDLDSKPVRIIVGEAKFRSMSSKAAVHEIIEGLARSHKAGIPVSLQFVAERLFETGRDVLGAKVLGCAKSFAQGKLRLDYVGLLMSDHGCANSVYRHTVDAVHRLAVISFAINSPGSIIDPCYKDLEKKSANTS
jgi:HamA